jgi:multiple sugar transport system permease protein
MEPFFWLFGVCGIYASILCSAVVSLLAMRLRRLPIAALSVVLLLVFFAVLLRGGASNGVFLVGLTAVTIALQAGIYKATLAPQMDWEAQKYRREMTRQTLLHLVLMSGSALFIIPFAWLVVTSLKEDKEMSQFPPVWIPTQQVKRNIDGVERGLANLIYEGQTLKVAVLKERDSGDRTVRVLEPASLSGREIACKKGDLKEIRRFAPVWKNYPDALKFLPPESNKGLLFVWNTLVISSLSILGTLLASSMVAYAFSRLTWPGRDTLFLALLATMMLPAAVTMMPVFLIFRSIGWIDTLYPLWVPAFFGSAFNIFLLRQFFMGIPTELEDAAQIDGCSYYSIFWRIVLPQVKPALAALTIMAFMGAWNDFRGPLIYISSPQNQPLAYALQLFQTARGGEPGLLMAASTMVMTPVLLLFFFTQRYFIQGITLTGIKG